jgi:hypothetical protein
MSVRSLVGLTLVTIADAHGSMLMPPSRNSVDADLPAWSRGKFPPTGLIEPYSCHCLNGTTDCSAGQSCFWFSQGVSVGCKSADGNGTRLPNLDHCPHERASGFDPLKMEGALDPMYRTTNIDAEPGSIQDIWKFNPWRAPGQGGLADPWCVAVVRSLKFRIHCFGIVPAAVWRAAPRPSASTLARTTPRRMQSKATSAPKS